MSAQAEQMKVMVGELVALVGGSGNGANQEHSSAVHTAKAKVHKALEVAAAPVKKAKSKAMVVHKAQKVTPEQVIPLGDDFKDF